MRKLKWLISLLMLLWFISPVLAVDSYFDISLDCYQGCKEGTASIEDQIMLKFTMKNNFDYWVYMGDKSEWDKSSSLRIIAENSNLENSQDTELYQFIVGNPIYIPPKSEIEIFIPLKAYNELDKDKRIGDWSVKPQLNPNQYNIKYFNNPFTGEIANIKPEFRIQSQITGNLLKFEAKKKEVVVDSNTGTMSEIIKAIWEFIKNWIGYIIAGIIIVVGGGIILAKFKKK